MAADIFVVSEHDVPARREPGDTAEVRVTIDASSGCENLEQRVVRYAPGRSLARSADGVNEVLYVAAGEATLRLDGAEHALEPGTGVLVVDGETYEIDNPGPDELLIVGVAAPSRNGVDVSRRRVTVRYSEQPPLPAGADREFRYLVNEESGHLDVTQFVGVIPPGRAPDHSHTYDEVIYVLEGEGVLHVGDRRTPIGAGSCIHLPPLLMHCLENTGGGPMRVLGVFHPSGDPASRAREANE